MYTPGGLVGCTFSVPPTVKNRAVGTIELPARLVVNVPAVSVPAMPTAAADGQRRRRAW